MGGSSSKQPAITARDKATLDLKVQRDKLKQYQKKVSESSRTHDKIQVVLEKEVHIAKQHLANGDKKRALIALKKKKYQENLILQTENQLFNLEQLTMSIETAVMEQQVLQGLEKGTQVLKEIHKELNVEAVDKLMEETADAIAYQNELDEMLSGKLTSEEEEDIMNELDKMIEVEMEQALPSVPQNEPVQEKQGTNDNGKSCLEIKKKVTKPQAQEPVLA